MLHYTGHTHTSNGERLRSSCIATIPTSRGGDPWGTPIAAAMGEGWIDRLSLCSASRVKTLLASAKQGKHTLPLAVYGTPLWGVKSTGGCGRALRELGRAAR